MVSIKFGTYSPPEKNGGRTSKTAHLSIGVFCDGTLNNRTNTESRINETSLRGAGDEAISCNKGQIATLSLAMTDDVRAEHFLPGCQSKNL
ncbi:MAG: hypothetical protein ACK5IQ_06985 [Bacteroidales bacterium]